MWQDTEAEVDLLNFSLVANAAAQLIRDSNGAPLTIGVSGGWGTGKSSLVKMVGAVLATDEEAKKSTSSLNSTPGCIKASMTLAKHFWRP